MKPGELSIEEKAKLVSMLMSVGYHGASFHDNGKYCTLTAYRKTNDQPELEATGADEQGAFNRLMEKLHTIRDLADKILTEMKA